MIEFREANIKDIETYFKWRNDPIVRALSFNSEIISYEAHKEWFLNKINDENCSMLLFFDKNTLVGQTRIEKKSLNQSIINISIPSESRGKGYSTSIIKEASRFFLKQNPKFIINAYIKKTNFKSIRAFEKALFQFHQETIFKEDYCLNYIFKNEDSRL